MEESRDESQGKIRKRGCSSSTSSSLVRKSRFKRAILVGKRVEVGTPVSTPKMVISRSPVSGDGTKLLKFPTSGRNLRDGFVSARRLAATLWEINEVSSPQRIKKSTLAGFPEIKNSDALPEIVGSVSERLSEPEIMYRAGRDELLEKKQRKTRQGFKGVCKALETTKELLRVLCHIWGVEERHSSSANSIVSAIRLEVDGAIAEFDRLRYERRVYRREVKSVMQRLAEERLALRAKERRVAAELAAERRMRRQAERRVAAELAAERRMRRQAERVNKKLGRESADGKVRLEELQRAKVEMLQVADALREERARMNLAEEKFQFEEGNADFEKLRIEMDVAYPYTLNDKDNNVTQDSDEDEELESLASANNEVLRDFLRKTLGKVCQNPNIDEAEKVDDESSESDTHFLELEIDGIRKKSFEWIASPLSMAQDDSKRSSVEVFKGRKSLSEKIQWASISLLKGGSATKDDTSTTTLQPQDNETQNEFTKPGSEVGNEDREDELKKHKAVKSLKQQILSSFRLGSTQGYINPANQWGQAKEVLI